MSVKRGLFVVLVAGVVLLAGGAGPRTAGIVRALPAEQRPGPGGVTIPYPGRLNDAAGQPAPDGAYDFTFTLYNAESSGEALWSEEQKGVAVRDGEFAASLGAVTPLPSLADGTYWLAVGVRGPGEAAFTALAPRQRVSAAAPAASFGPTANGACPHTHLGEVWGGWTGPGDGLWLKGNVNWSSGIFLVDNNGSGPAIWGYNNGGGNAVRGEGEGPGSLGVYGSSEQSAGVVGRSTNGRGVEGYSTNSYGVFAHSDNASSIYVDGAGGDGVRVASAASHGVYVASAGWDGVAVWSAAVAGMYVHSAGADGILVDTATWDGVHVTGPVGGNYYGSGKKGDEDFAVLNSGEVRSKVGFAAPANDFAVTMPVEGDKAGYEPGDVLVVSASGSGAAERSSAAYSPAVLGVYSAAPAFVGGRTVTGDAQAGGLPVTILGIVSCKVSAENGPIRPGDLLVTSATPGHAMRADCERVVPGTVLGKALESLDSGTGVIQVLVTLQ